MIWIGDCINAFPVGSLIVAALTFGLGLTVGMAFRFRDHVGL